MRKIEHTAKYRTDYKRERKRDPRIESRLRPVVEALARNKPLPDWVRDHKLKGKWQDHRECHIRGDLLLIYRRTAERLVCVRLGSHSELFGR